jgi:hypothetical protein
VFFIASVVDGSELGPPRKPSRKAIEESGFHQETLQHTNDFLSNSGVRQSLHDNAKILFRRVPPNISKI